MRVLVLAHRLELGGTQTNAIELAARVRDRHGTEVLLAAAPGKAVSLARDKGLDLRLIPDAEHHPSLRRVRALTPIARSFRPDVLHVWDWPQCFDAYPGLHMAMRLPVLCTVMGMVVPSFIPRQLPTTFGTEDLASRARRLRRGPVHLLEPPVDLHHNRPGAVDGEAFRRQLAVAPGEVVVVMVTRLESWLKLEGLLRAIDAVDALAGSMVRLVIVGEGTARWRVEERARDVNRRHGRQVVQLTGGLVDPRPAYAAADVMLGMGGSALRTMAFGKALIVLGERGFSRVLDETTLPMFLRQGFYGLGDGGEDDLRGQLGGLVASPAERARLGALGRCAVEERFGLDAAADRLVSWYAEAAARPIPMGPALSEGARTLAILAARRGRAAAEKILRQRG